MYATQNAKQYRSPDILGAAKCFGACVSNPDEFKRHFQLDGSYPRSCAERIVMNAAVLENDCFWFRFLYSFCYTSTDHFPETLRNASANGF